MKSLPTPPVSKFGHVTERIGTGLQNRRGNPYASSNLAVASNFQPWDVSSVWPEQLAFNQLAQGSNPCRPTNTFNFHGVLAQSGQSSWLLTSSSGVQIPDAPPIVSDACFTGR